MVDEDEDQAIKALINSSNQPTTRIHFVQVLHPHIEAISHLFHVKK
jgi:hypothetical protein